MIKLGNVLKNVEMLTYIYIYIYIIEYIPYMYYLYIMLLDRLCHIYAYGFVKTRLCLNQFEHQWNFIL